MHPTKVPVSANGADQQGNHYNSFLPRLSDAPGSPSSEGLHGHHNIFLPRLSEAPSNGLHGDGPLDQAFATNERTNPDLGPTSGNPQGRWETRDWESVMSSTGRHSKSFLPRFEPQSVASTTYSGYGEVGIDPMGRSKDGYNLSGRVWRPSWHAASVDGVGLRGRPDDLYEGIYPLNDAGQSGISPSEVKVNLADSQKSLESWLSDRVRSERLLGDGGQPARNAQHDASDIYRLPPDVKVEYHEVFKEWQRTSDTQHSVAEFATTTHITKNTYSYAKRFAYYGPLLASGLYLGALWGLAYGVLVYLLTWVVRPVLKVIFILLNVLWALMRAVILTVVQPFFEACGIVFSKSNGHLAVSLSEVTLTFGGRAPSRSNSSSSASVTTNEHRVSQL